MVLNNEVGSSDSEVEMNVKASPAPGATEESFIGENPYSSQQESSSGTTSRFKRHRLKRLSKMTPEELLAYRKKEAQRVKNYREKKKVEKTTQVEGESNSNSASQSKKIEIPIIYEGETQDNVDKLNDSLDTSSEKKKSVAEKQKMYRQNRLSKMTPEELTEYRRKEAIRVKMIRERRKSGSLGPASTSPDQPLVITEV